MHLDRRKQFIERPCQSIRLHDVGMIAPQLARVTHPSRMRDNAHLVVQVPHAIEFSPSPSHDFSCIDTRLRDVAGGLLEGLGARPDRMVEMPIVWRRPWQAGVCGSKRESLWFLSVTAPIGC